LGPTKKRARFVSGVLMALFIALLGRLLELQVLDRGELAQKASSQYDRKVPVPAPRGRILDRCDRALALSERGYDLCFYPNQEGDPRRVALDVARALGVPLESIEERFLPLSANPYHKRYIARALTADDASAVCGLGYAWLKLEPRESRVYPFGASAGWMLGFVGAEGHGMAGAELAFERELSGVEGWYLATKDGRGCEVALAGTGCPPSSGEDVKLTVDLAVQRILERELEAACRQWSASGAAAVAMDPWTGEILGMASWPTFDPSQPSAAPKGARDRTIGFVYEPGSTFKVVTISAVLEEGVFALTDMIDCGGGRFTYLRHTISDVHGYGRLSVENAIVNSSNVAAAKMGLALGSEKLYRYVSGFGFGEATGIELPGEERGILRPLSQWSKLSPAVIPYGYEVGVTPLQMARATCAVATDGSLPTPTLRLGAVGDSKRVISPETARKVREALLGVVRAGTGRNAAVAGYSVAGKTGTAHKAGPGGYTDTYIGSFVGFAPADNPKVVVMVMIDEPKGAHYGGTVAGPVFSRIMTQLLAYMKVSPDEGADLGGEGELPTTVVAGDAAAAASAAQAVADCPERRPGVVVLAAAQTKDGAIVVPSLVGLSARDAVKMVNAVGLAVRVWGAGLVSSQSPLPGETLLPGGFVELKCRPPVESVAHARGGK